ncbi:MAG: hypothetical protein LBM12_01165 [Candidatus Nomurabacteria bacterium]|nr:hypothetical protein [Candidatus Nomurabacteria bacterium]
MSERLGTNKNRGGERVAAETKKATARGQKTKNIPQVKEPLDERKLAIANLNQQRWALQREFWQELHDTQKQATFNRTQELLTEMHTEDASIIVPDETYDEQTIERYENRLQGNQLQIADATRGMTQEARAEATGSYDSNNQTVEVQSGALYNKRVGRLQKALDSARITDEERQKSNATLNATRDLYKKHQDLADKNKNPQPAGIMESQEYYRERARAHNNLINNLNETNKLCEKYGVRRLTYRNFLVSDPYQDKVDPYLHHRQEEDRAIVENYFYVAYGGDRDLDYKKRSSAEQKAEAKKPNLFDNFGVIPGEDDPATVRMQKVAYIEQLRADGKLDKNR